MKKTIAIVAAATMTIGSAFADGLKISDNAEITNTIAGTVTNTSTGSGKPSGSSVSIDTNSSTITSGIKAYDLNMTGGELSAEIGTNGSTENAAYNGANINSGIQADNAVLNNAKITEYNNGTINNEAQGEGSSINSGIIANKAELNSVEVSNSVGDGMTVGNSAIGGGTVNSGINISSYKNSDELVGGKIQNNLSSGEVINNAEGKDSSINSGITAIGASAWNNPIVTNNVESNSKVHNDALKGGSINSGINLNRSMLGDWEKNPVQGTVVNTITEGAIVDNDSAGDKTFVNSGIFAVNNSRIANNSFVHNKIASSITNDAKGGSRINSGIQLSEAPKSHGGTSDADVKYNNIIENVVEKGADYTNQADGASVINSGIKMYKTVIDRSNINNTATSTAKLDNTAMTGSLINSGITVIGQKDADEIDQSTIGNIISGSVSNDSRNASSIHSGIVLGSTK